MGKKNGYAVVTGATSGIGKVFAYELAKEGFDLILVARRKARLIAIQKELVERFGIRCKWLEADLSKFEGCKKVESELSSEKIAVFINNAGFGDCGNFMDRDWEKESEMIDLNIKAVHFLTKVVLRKMQKQKGGYLLNVASSAGLLPAGPFMATYYATKSYVASFTRAIAYELKEKNSPVYVGVLCPGPVDTEFNEVARVKFALPGISAETCVSYAIRQMKRKKTVIIPGKMIKLGVLAGRIVPESMAIAITARQQKRKM